MYRREHTQRVAALLTALAALAFFAGSGQAANSRPAGTTEAEYRALMIRTEALNNLNGNAVTRLSPRLFKELYEAGASRMTPQEFAALVARSEGLNRRYSS